MHLAPRAVALVAAIAVAACTHFAVADEGRIKTSKPQVVVISLDGAKPDLIESYLKSGALDKKTGLGRLKAHAAGPSLKQHRKLDVIHNIDVAPTVMDILGVAPAPTVDGAVIPKILRKQRD